jgi:hypothetical protein
MSKIIETRNLFVNTDNTLIGECRNTTLSLPQGLMMCRENEQMRITLNSFAMRNSWYRLNKYNTVFYIVAFDTSTSSVKHARVKIDEGNYTSFTGTNGLNKAIKVAMETALTTFSITTPSCDVLYDEITNRITISFETAVGGTLVDLKLVTFTINTFNPQSSSTNIIEQILEGNEDDAFNNTFEMMGGCYEKRDVLEGTEPEQLEQLTSMYNVTQVGLLYTFEGLFNATLQTEENIYLRTNLHSSSYQTAGFDSGSTLYPNIVSSQILAKIPLNNPVFAFVKETKDSAEVGEFNYERPYELVKYSDNGNNMYSILLESKAVSTLRLFVTDSYGRLIPEISLAQIACNAMSFTASLRIDVFEK